MIVARHAPTSASSYIPVPGWLNHDHERKRFLNIQNLEDKKCFLLSVLAMLDMPAVHPQRVGHIPKEGNVNMTGIKYPVEVKLSQNLNNKILC